MKNYISSGERVTLISPAALASGQLVAIGSKVVVAMSEVGNGVPFTALIKGEVEGVLKDGDDPTAMQAMYLNGAGELTVDSDDGGDPAVEYVFAGYCSEPGTAKIILA
jgi:predicted RecA/RadA family phage recombinase